MTTYREAIRTALAVHAGYRACAASEHYSPSPRPCATVEAAAYWYGADDRAYAYDELTGAFYATDARTYRALAVLLRVAPLGGRSYLGVPLRIVAAASVAIAAASVALSLALPPASCDDGERCATAQEYAETVARLEAIAETRTGGRFNGTN